MKIATVIEKFSGSEEIFRCPICKRTFSPPENGSFVCENGHCFDLSSKGYINFLSSKSGGNTHSSGDARYDGELFSHRRAVFRDGFYAPVADAITGLATRYLPENGRVVIDAGCGEGYYSHFLAQKMEAEVYGIDNSKDAVLAAAKTSGNARFMVADLANMPVQTGAAGLVLNILTPANYGEFARVLCKDGTVIKAIPGERYLQELRACVFAQNDYSNQKIIDHMAEHADIAEHKIIEYTLSVSHGQLFSFYKMTPMTTHVQTDADALAAIRHITIHLELFALRPKKQSL